MNIDTGLITQDTWLITCARDLFIDSLLSIHD